MNPAVAALTIFPIVVTKTIDTIRNAFDASGRAPAWVWNLLAFALGLGIAFVWKVNALEAISETPAQGQLGQFLTGIGIGSTSSGWHEIFDAFSGIAKGRRNRLRD